MSLVRNEERTPEQLSELLAILQAQGYGQASLGALMGEYLALPGLVGFWPGTAIGNTASGSFDNLTDLSGHALHLAKNGSAVITLTDGGAPFISVDGVGDYYNHADAALFDILGTELHVAGAYRGLTIGAYVYFRNAASASEMVISKWNTSNLSYALLRNAAGNMQLSITSNGLVGTQVNVTTAVVSTDTYYFVCARFDPSTSLDIYLNDVKSSNTTSIPAAIFGGSAVFNIAANGGGSSLMDGRIAFPFLCAAAVPDNKILSLYHMGKRLFGA